MEQETANSGFGSKEESAKIKFEMRVATQEDVSSIQTLNKELFDYEISEGFSENLDSNWSLSEEGEKEIRERITSKESSCGFVCKVDEKIVGYLIGRILEDETGRAESKYADLEHKLVDKDYRGNNIGEKLVQEFKKWAKSKGLKIIKANVSYGNKRAVNFYKKVGLIPSDIMMVATIG